jgi:MoaA/NifB/PqqE/SkfB family radical SAM enzyme
MNFWSRFRQSYDFIRRSTNPSVPPLEWMVETTNRCNLACPMCTRTNVSFQPAE